MLKPNEMIIALTPSQIEAVCGADDVVEDLPNCLAATDALIKLSFIITKPLHDNFIY